MTVFHAYGETGGLGLAAIAITEHLGPVVDQELRFVCTVGDGGRKCPAQWMSIHCSALAKSLVPLQLLAGRSWASRGGARCRRFLHQPVSSLQCRRDSQSSWGRPRGLTVADHGHVACEQNAALCPLGKTSCVALTAFPSRGMLGSLRGGRRPADLEGKIPSAGLAFLALRSG